MSSSISMESLVSLSDVELADEEGGVQGGYAQLGGRYVDEIDGGEGEGEGEGERESGNRRMVRQVSPNMYVHIYIIYMSHILYTYSIYIMHVLT